MLEYEIDKFLAEYKINNGSCGHIYERTLLELAGVTTEPESIYAERGHYFSVKSLTQKEAEKFAQFFNDNGDKSANAKDLFGKWHHVRTDADIALKNILPLFKERFREFAAKNPDKITEYQEKSKKHFPDNPTRLQVLTKQAEKAYMERAFDKEARDKARQDSIDLFPKLNEILKEFEINTHRCDVFEETILKLAGIGTQPKRCSFGCEYAPFYGPTLVLAVQPSGTGRISFNISGLTLDDAVKLTEYFMNQGDKTVRCDDRSAQCKDTYHQFNVDASVVYDKILPQFKEYIQREELLGSYRLEKYRELCKKDFEIKEPAPVQEQPTQEQPQQTPAGSSVVGMFKRCLGHDTSQPEAAKDARPSTKRY